MKAKRIIVGLLIVSVLGYLIYQLFFKKNGKMISLSGSQMTLEEAWRSFPATEFTKEVFFEGKNYRAQVKRIKGFDVALLSTGRVVIFDNDENSWMPAGSYDLKMEA